MADNHTPAATLQPTSAFSPALQFKMYLNRVCAYDPETGVYMQRGARNPGRFTVIYGGWTNRRWRFRVYADSVDNAIGLANIRLAKISPEVITTEPNPKYAGD